MSNSYLYIFFLNLWCGILILIMQHSGNSIIVRRAKSSFLVYDPAYELYIISDISL